MVRPVGGPGAVAPAALPDAPEVGSPDAPVDPCLGPDGTASPDAADTRVATRPEAPEVEGPEPSGEPTDPRAPVIDPSAPLVSRRASDDSAVGWHESDDSNDERLRRDVPPHWA